MLGESTALLSHLVSHLTFFVVQSVWLEREEEAGKASTQYNDSLSTQCGRWQMQRLDIEGQVYQTPGTGRKEMSHMFVCLFS